MFCVKTNLIASNFFEGFTDYHSHILPAVDDGMNSLDESLETLNFYEQLGIVKVVLTPHINAQQNHPKDLHAKQFAILKQHYKGKIEFNLAAEYMLDAGFERQISEGLRYVTDRRVLVETSYAAAPNNFYELLYAIALMGDIPLIAHPERYMYMSKRDYIKLKDKGYEYQLNILSLLGAYGKEVKRNAEYLLENNMYDFVGTDIHSLSRFRNIVDTIRIAKSQLRKIERLK